MPRIFNRYLLLVSVSVLIAVVIAWMNGWFSTYKGLPIRNQFRSGIFSSEFEDREVEFVFATQRMMLTENASIDLTGLKLIGELYFRVPRKKPHTGYLDVYIEGEKITDEESLQMWRERMLDFAESIRPGDDTVLAEFKVGLVSAAIEPALPIEENE